MLAIVCFTSGVGLVAVAIPDVGVSDRRVSSTAGYRTFHAEAWRVEVEVDDKVILKRAIKNPLQTDPEISRTQGSCGCARVLTAKTQVGRESFIDVVIEVDGTRKEAGDSEARLFLISDKKETILEIPVEVSLTDGDTE